MTVLTVAQRDQLYGVRCRVPRTTVTNPWGDRVNLHDLIVPVYLEASWAAKNDKACVWQPQRTDSYACRLIRGSTNPSLHAWALAADKFATPEGVPPPGGVWKPDNPLPPEFARHYTQRGFRWGRWFARQDWPHLEWPEEPPLPRTTTTLDPEEARVALNKPACSIVLTPTDEGYWIVAQDGGIFAFGDATPFGVNPLPSRTLNAPIVAAACTSSGEGLALLGADGGVFTFGDAAFHGSAAG